MDTKTTKDQEVISDKELRVEIDGVIQKVRKLTPSRERSLCFTNLQLAVMWLGMDLKERNELNPYPNSYKPENVIVDKTADGLKL